MTIKRKHLTVGILAHVDAGKTTLCEAMLYRSGAIRKLGRVDRRDSFLDDRPLERERGITIFSKQAELQLGNTDITLLDTPGHADLAAETERVLPVLDCAVLVISGTDGVQAHTETVWRLLQSYEVPVFLFLTKMDLSVCDRPRLTKDLQRHLSEYCLELKAEEMEQIALGEEQALEEYLEQGRLCDATLTRLIRERKLFPCFYGSGLKTDGVDELLEALERYTEEKEYGEEFGARVFKIARDPKGNRLTFLKVTGGSLKPRSVPSFRCADGSENTEKITELRLYSGAKYSPLEEAQAGRICAVAGLNGTFPGQGMGMEPDGGRPMLEPVLSYRVLLPEGVDARMVLPKLQQLQEEDPQLHILWDEKGGCIRTTLMGKMQTEIFISLVKERFDLDISLDTGAVLYRETIANLVEGVGHFEPLRHYAEVHLLLEPLPVGSGLRVGSCCPEDSLDRNWQRLILTHVLEKKHLGALIGAPVTDIKITLAAGRAHLKHTEGGDFRQATYRAIRQGLRKAEKVLLEPLYEFSLSVPPEMVGRAITDVRAMGGSFSSPEEDGELMRITGRAPVSEMNGYFGEVAAYTRGRGRFSCCPGGYAPCHNTAEVLEQQGYDADADQENTADSVFCAHGAGYNVPWNQVEDYMHLDSVLAPKRREEAPAAAVRREQSIDDRELEAIMLREFGPVRRKQYSAPVRNAAEPKAAVQPMRTKLAVVDGYNLIFALPELKKLAEERLDLARGRLLDRLSDYAAFTKTEVVCVFDGFRTPGNPGSREDYHNIHVVFTGDGETGDAWIQSFVGEIGRNYAVRVISSDNLIRLSAFGSGVLRSSSREFGEELALSEQQLAEVLKKNLAEESRGRDVIRVQRRGGEKTGKEPGGDGNGSH